MKTLIAAALAFLAGYRVANAVRYLSDAALEMAAMEVQRRTEPNIVALDQADWRRFNTVHRRVN